MLASEYIRKLKALVDEYGDCVCVDSYDNNIGEPEMVDEGAPIFVLADKA